MSRRRLGGGRWILLICAAAVVFAVLRLLSGPAEPASASAFFTTRVVVVGVQGRTAPDATDRRIIDTHRGRVQAGAVSVRPELQGECAAAGWLTLGAGRRTTAGGLCSATVRGGGDSARVTDWAQRAAAAAAHGGDARLGTLASLSRACIQAVGPGAALAAAGPDGRLDHYLTAEEFAATGFRPDCPLTLVDAGSSSDRVIAALAARPDLTVVVTGIGPRAGSHDPALQLIYRLGTTIPGTMTSQTTRRDGIVTLSDLTRTLAGFVRAGRPMPAGTPLDGTRIQVRPGPVTAAGAAAQLRTLAALSDVAPIGYAAAGVIGLGLAVLLALAVVRRRRVTAQTMIAALSVFTAALMLTGSVPWAAASRPAWALLAGFVGWLVILTAAALGLARRLRIPVPIVAATLTMATFTVDAALGGPMQPGSLLNSRPVVGGRWYGFGNSTFGCYAVATLTVAGYLAHRMVRAGRRRAPMIAVLAVGGLAVTCEGWPSMGADFGGVISLVPAVLGLALAVSGIRVTWPRLIVIAAAAVVAVAAVSVLDWARGPGARSHLGDFVQRLISGDAWPIIWRKAVASGSTLVAPLGLVAVVVGALVWVTILRRLQHAIPADLFVTYRPTAVAVLATSILGTLLNDAGISVFLTVTGPFAMTTAGLLWYRYRAHGWSAVVHGEAFADRPTRGAGTGQRRPGPRSRSGNPAVRGRRRRR